MVKAKLCVSNTTALLPLQDIRVSQTYTFRWIWCIPMGRFCSSSTCWVSGSWPAWPTRDSKPSSILTRPPPTHADPIPYNRHCCELIPIPKTSTLLSSHLISSTSPLATWSAKCVQVGEVGFDTVDYIVRCMSIQRTGNRPISYIHHCVVSLCPQGLQQTGLSNSVDSGTSRGAWSPVALGQRACVHLSNR